MKLVKEGALAIIAASLIACGSKTDSTETTKPDSTKKPEVVEETETTTQSDFGSLLVELESNIGWGAVTSGWKDRRDGWVNACMNETDVLAKANLLIEFESYLKWEAVDPSWADRREAWIYDSENSTTNADLGNYLAELEQYIIWDVVSPNWVNVREQWVNNCLGLAEGDW